MISGVHFSGEMAYQPERGEHWEAGYAHGTIRPVEKPDLAVEAKLLVRFREPIPLRYGDRIEVEGVLRQPNGQRNPGGFDYRSYLARRQVFRDSVSTVGAGDCPNGSIRFPPIALDGEVAAAG